MKEGYIKLHRQVIDWEWYKNSNVKIVFLHCLLKANHKDNKWQGIIVKKGSFITSYLKLAQEVDLSEMKVRTALNKLKLTGEITCQANSKYTMISINNWDDYQQNNMPFNNQTTDKYQTDNNQITTNNNDKNEENEKVNNIEIFQKPFLEEVTKYCNERNNNVNPQTFIDYYSSKGWKIGKNSMVDWKAAIRTWENNSKQFSNSSGKDITCLTGTTFNSKYESYSED